jgi:hypothetical protein
MKMGTGIDLSPPTFFTGCYPLLVAVSLPCNLSLDVLQGNSVAPAASTVEHIYMEQQARWPGAESAFALRMQCTRTGTVDEAGPGGQSRASNSLQGEKAAGLRYYEAHMHVPIRRP